MNVDDFVFVAPHEVRRENFHEPRQHDEINLPLVKQFQRLRFRLRAVFPRNADERQAEFFGHRFEIGPVADDEREIGHHRFFGDGFGDRFKTPRFLGHKNGEALAAIWLDDAHFDFHVKLAGQPVQSGAHGGGGKIFFGPRRLQSHAELPARDLLLERFNVGVLLKQKSGDAGDDAGFVPANDSDGGVLFHFKTFCATWRSRPGCGLRHRLGACFRKLAARRRRTRRRDACATFHTRSSVLRF